MTSRRIRHWVWLCMCLYVVFPLSLGVQADYQASQEGEDTTQADTPELSVQEVLRKVDAVALLLELPPLACLDETTTVRRVMFEAFPVVEVAHKRAGIEFAVDEDPESLYEFHCDPTPAPEGLGRSAAMNVGAIAARASVFLTRVGIDMEVIEEDLRLEVGGGDQKSPLNDTRWILERVYNDGNVPAQDFRVFLSFSAYTGRVTDFTKRPVFEPSASQEENLPLEEGREDIYNR